MAAEPRIAHETLDSYHQRLRTIEKLRRGILRGCSVEWSPRPVGKATKKERRQQKLEVQREGRLSEHRQHQLKRDSD